MKIQNQMTKTTTGIIIKIISNDFTVLDELNNIHVCKARGKFRNLKITPLVGDNVVIDIENNYILEVKKRRNELVRPSVSNIDQLFIITSVKHPNFDTNLLDKLLCIAEFNCIKPIICLTKVDLLNRTFLLFRFRLWRIEQIRYFLIIRLPYYRHKLKFPPCIRYGP